MEICMQTYNICIQLDSKTVDTCVYVNSVSLDTICRFMHILYIFVFVYIWIQSIQRIFIDKYINVINYRYIKRYRQVYKYKKYKKYKIAIKFNYSEIMLLLDSESQDILHRWKGTQPLLVLGRKDQQGRRYSSG